jgi:hypothetical protein
MDNQIIKGVGKGVGELGKETLEKTAQETGKIFESVITGKELLGDITPLSDEEMARKNQEEEKKKQEEMARLKSQMAEHGRNIEEELKELREEEKREEQEEEREEMTEKQQEQQEIAAQEAEEGILMPSTNPAKQKKSRGSAFANKKKQQPDASQMSQTTEFKGKID